MNRLTPDSSDAIGGVFLCKLFTRHRTDSTIIVGANLPSGTLGGHTHSHSRRMEDVELVTDLDFIKVNVELGIGSI